MTTSTRQLRPGYRPYLATLTTVGHLMQTDAAKLIYQILVDEAYGTRSYLPPRHHVHAEQAIAAARRGSPSDLIVCIRSWVCEINEDRLKAEKRRRSEWIRI